MLLDQVSISLTSSASLQLSQQFQVKVNPAPTISTKKYVQERHPIYITNPKNNQLSKVTLFQTSIFQKQTIKFSANNLSNIFTSHPNDLFISYSRQGVKSNNEPYKRKSQIRKKTIRDIITRNRLQLFTQKNGENANKEQQQQVLNFLLNQKKNKQKLQIQVNCPINQLNLSQFNLDKLQMFQFMINFFDENKQIQKTVTVNIPFGQNDKNQVKKKESIKALASVMQEFEGLNKIIPNLKLNFKNQEQQGSSQQRYKSARVFPVQQRLHLQTIAEERQKIQQMIENSYVSNQSGDSFRKVHDKAKFQYVQKKILDSEKGLIQSQNKIPYQQQQDKVNQRQMRKFQKDQNTKNQKQQSHLLDFRRFINIKSTKKSTQVMALGLRRGSYSEQQIRKITKRQMKPKKFVILINRVDIQEEDQQQSIADKNNNQNANNYQKLTKMKLNKQNYQNLM